MTGVFAIAQAAANVDPNAIGISVTNLIGSLGAAGAAVAVTYYFLGFLKTEGEKQTRVFSDFRDYHAESQRKFQEQLDRLTDRQEHLQRAFQEQVTRMTEAQNALLRDAILAMKSVEKTVENSVVSIHGLEKSISAMQASINNVQMVLNQLNDVAVVSKIPRNGLSAKETTS
jgi:prefoldin subunit 5